MIYPNLLKENDVISCVGVSDGVSDELDKKRFFNGKKKLENLGYKVEFGKNVFETDKWFRSLDGKTRADLFNDLFKREDVSVIVAAKGGNFECEMLEYVDFERIAKNPKWFQGYSDNTCLVHAITTMCDIASIYGSNFGEFGMEKWHRSVAENIDILTKNENKTEFFDKYQKDLAERTDGLEGYNLDTDSKLKLDNMSLKKGRDAKFSGRLLGGCLDVLAFLQGTRYDNTLEYINKYKNDGIVWYLESFETSGESLMMTLWKLKEIGWFKYTKGIIFGRELFYRDFLDVSYEDAAMEILGNLDIPIIFNGDVGHVGPRIPMVNGAMADIYCSVDGKGFLRQIYK